MKFGFKYIGALLVLVFCVVTLDFDASRIKFLIFSLVIYAACAALILSKRLWMSVSGIWLAVFLIAQTLITPLVIDRNLKTLQPNLNLVVDIKDGYAGIEGKQVITTDAYGFRNAADVDYESAEPYRIFAIGGSTTEQIKLDDKLTWVAKLEAILQSKSDRPVEVINTGLSGLRAEHHLATLKYILKLNPDMVIFLQGINDWNWHIKNRDTSPVWLKLSGMRDSLVFSNTILGRTAKKLYDAIRYEPVGNQSSAPIEDHGEYYNARRGSLNREIKIDFRPDSVHSLYRENLVEIMDVCSTNEIPCVFVTQPTGYSLDADRAFRDSFWMTPPFDIEKESADYTLTLESMIDISKLYNGYLVETAARKKMPACKLATAIEPSFDYFYDDCHYNVNGANAVAIKIAQCLSTLIP